MSNMVVNLLALVSQCAPFRQRQRQTQKEKERERICIFLNRLMTKMVVSYYYSVRQGQRQTEEREGVFKF